ncbi:MAG: TolC family protein [Arenicella sp.]
MKTKNLNLLLLKTTFNTTSWLCRAIQENIAKRSSCSLLICFLVLQSHYAIAAKQLNIGMLYDGTSEGSVIDASLVKREIKTILEPEFSVNFSEENGEWTAEGIGENLESLLRDPNVDMVIPLGLYGSHAAGKIPVLKKPVIASFIPDPELQNIPLTKDARSGKKNYTYISGLQSFRQDMERVFKVLPTNKVALLGDRLIIEGIPELTNTRSLFGDREIEIISMEGSLNDALSNIPDGVDTLLVAPLSKFTNDDVIKFSEALIKRNIKSVSFAGANEVRQGLLLAVGSQPSDDLRLARRIALNVFSILSGDKASELPVTIQWGQRISYNVDTAKSIGFELPWDLALTSEKIYSKKALNSTKSDLSLTEVIDLAIERNLSYEIEKLNLDISQDDVLIAKSKWWPQVELSAQYTQLDQEVASSANPEKSTDANVSASQLLYSETAKSALDSAELSKLSGNEQLEIALLDTIGNVAQIYFTILRSQALRDVQRSNLLVSIQNLELSENRFRLGAVNQTDVLRWQSQIARDKQNLLAAETDVNNAIINLQTFLHLPLSVDQSFDLLRQKELIAQVLSEPIRQIFDQPQQRQLLEKWTIEKGIESAPELKQATYQQRISERQLLSSQRSRFVPDVSLTAAYGKNLSRDGVSAVEADQILPDSNWSVGLRASLPLLTGGERQANISKAKSLLKQSELRQEITKDNVRFSIWNALNQLSSSYPAIRLSQQAVDAAEKNLNLIREQYSSGTIQITTLIDAQNSTLSAQLAAAQAEYSYLIDMVGLMRAISDFRFFRDPNRVQSWLAEFSEYREQSLNHPNSQKN